MDSPYETLSESLEAERRARQAAESELANSTQEFKVFLSQAQATATIAERKVLQLLNSVVDGILQVDLDLRIVACNPAAQILFEYSRDELLAMTLDDVMASLNDAFLDMGDAVRSATHAESGGLIEAYGIRNGGALVPVEVTFSVIPEDGQLNYLVIIRNVTERHEAELELSRLNLELQAIFDSATHLSIITTDPSGIITTFNTGAEVLLEYSADELVGQQTAAIFHDPDEVAARQASLTQEFGHPITGHNVFYHVPTLRGTETRDWTYISRSGKRFSMNLTITAMRDDDGHLIGYLKVGQDVTQAKADEVMLRLLQSAVDQANDAMAITDARVDADGPTIMYVNQAFSRMWGYSSTEIAGHSLRTLISSDETEDDLLASAQGKLLAGKPYSGMTLSQRRDGSVFDAEWRITPIRNHEDVVTHFVSAQTDITQKLAAERALARRDRILNAIAYASEVFLEKRDPLGSIANVLGRLGKASDASRAWIFENELDGRGQVCMSARYYWASPDWELPDGPDGFKLFPYNDAGLSRWLEVLSRGESIHGPTCQFPSGERAMMEQHSVKSLVIMPIMTDGSCWGFISLGDCVQERAWFDAELDALKVAASTFSAAVRRARIENALKASSQRESLTASRIQQALLFDATPPSIQGIDIAALTVPSQNVDGDFYSFPIITEHSLDFLIGDVMGKGVPAALLGAGTKSYFQRAITSILMSSKVPNELPDLGAIVTHVHGAMVRQLILLDSFMTMIYGRIDSKRMVFEFIDCGHTSILHFRAAEQDCILHKGQNVPLGFLEDERYTVTQIKIAPDDILLVYSDGVTEAVDADGEMYGVERARKLVSDLADRGIEEIVRTLCEDVKAYADERFEDDDLTIVAAKVNGRTMVPALLKVSIKLVDGLADIGALHDFLTTHAGPYLTEPRLLDELLLAAHESMTNILVHAFGNSSDRQAAIDVTLLVHPGQIVLDLAHQGSTFVPAVEVPEPPPMDGSKEGGFGLYIIQNAVDEVVYRTDEDGVQHILLTKRTTMTTDIP